MRRFLSGLAFSLIIITSIAAQGNGNGGYGNNGNGNGGYGNNGYGNNGYGNNGNGNNGNGNGGYGNNGFGQGNSAWANVNWPQWVINWLENGGQIPPLLAANVIWEARAWGQQNFSLGYGQMLQRYAQGNLTLSYLSTSPPSLTFRVAFGGLNVIVVVDL